MQGKRQLAIPPPGQPDNVIIYNVPANQSIGVLIMHTNPNQQEQVPSINVTSSNQNFGFFVAIPELG